MPTISIFYGMVIQMYWNDHAPPHFPVRYADSRATVGIKELQILTGSLPRNAERMVLEWAEEHQTNWRRIGAYANRQLCRRRSSPWPRA